MPKFFCIARLLTRETFQDSNLLEGLRYAHWSPVKVSALNSLNYSVTRVLIGLGFMPSTSETLAVTSPLISSERVAYTLLQQA